MVHNKGSSFHSYRALSRGTDGFAEANLLGKGRFGAVYKCVLEGEARPVAVKLFNLQQSGSSKSFEVECDALRRVRHRCLMKIITCCSSIDNEGQEFKALVFEFMPNDSLDGWVHPKSSMRTPSNTLSLQQRLDIAVDIMDALDYLHSHCQPPISHCDLKPDNILLAEDIRARVGDFGISRILSGSECESMQNSYTSAGVGGSIGYIAPGNSNSSIIIFTSRYYVTWHADQCKLLHNCRVQRRFFSLNSWRCLQPWDIAA